MDSLTIVWHCCFIVFCAVIVIQLFYYIYFFARLAFHKQKEKIHSQEYPVSVIICARDEASKLSKNLPCILVQKYHTTHEVIVVNDNSVDESKYLLEAFKKSFKNLTPIYLTQEAKLIPGKKFPLSMGIKSAIYEILLLTDADCMPASEHWLQKMQDAYSPGIDIVLGYGPYFKLPGLLNKLIRFETFHTALQYLSFALAGLPYMGVGRNLSYKKELFFANKGFSSINQILGGDDDLFINMVATKNNTAIVVDHEAHAMSMPKKTWKEWWKQKQRHYSTARFYKPKYKWLLGLYSFSHFMLYPLLIVSMITVNWWIPALLFASRALVQAIVWHKSMCKLNEKDLWFFSPLFDFLMFIYYLLFVPALWKKPRKTWN